MSKVLVTGGSGFLASHVILQLLDAGHEVRTTIRKSKQERQVLETLKSSGAKTLECLSFALADLTKDDGWSEAVAGCEHILHVASPFPSVTPQNEDEVIVPAREGTFRVLRSARDGGVHRVVMTSSFGAIGYGHPDSKTRFDERDWTNVEIPKIGAYIKSKTLAERAAWDFVRTDGGSLELAVVNPVGIFGPALNDDLSASVLMIKRMLDGAIPGCPRIYFGVVDVRDVANLHLRAMTDPKAAGERFVAVAGNCVSMFDVAQMLRRHLGDDAAKVPQRQIPDWQIRIAALWNADARQTLPNVGKVRNSSNAKARQVLGWEPRSTEDAVVATAESLIRLGKAKEGTR
ncbi:SDR family oxidoreductase [Geomonas subterranea]|uniref:SDR family oxidoreductase n=1 Tax=Geomonas subterranea TaxID=2847989 RepID=UPI001CD4F5AC|nr:aldehyde reductase [Geomonas fuzhouensis]